MTTDRTISHNLSRKFSNFNDVLLEHCYVWNIKFECDFTRIKRSLFFHEYEIKASRADFLRDFNKDSKHRQIAQGRSGLATFTFVIKEGQITADEIPSYAGLWTYIDMGFMVKFTEVIKAPRLKTPRKLDGTEMFRIFKNLSFRSYLKDKEGLK